MALTVGETLEIKATVADATAVEARLGGAGVSTHAMTLTSGEWIASIDTAEFASGNYVAEIWATYTGNKKKIITRESFTLRAALSEGDMRSVARQALDNINLMLSKQATEGVESYRINNRELKRYSIDELLKLKSHFAAIVRQEERKNKGLSGLGPRIAVRF